MSWPPHLLWSEIQAESTVLTALSDILHDLPRDYVDGKRLPERTDITAVQTASAQVVEDKPIGTLITMRKEAIYRIAKEIDRHLISQLSKLSKIVPVEDVPMAVTGLYDMGMQRSHVGFIPPIHEREVWEDRMRRGLSSRAYENFYECATPDDVCMLVDRSVLRIYYTSYPDVKTRYNVSADTYTTTITVQVDAVRWIDNVR